MNPGHRRCRSERFESQISHRTAFASGVRRRVIVSSEVGTHCKLVGSVVEIDPGVVLIWTRCSRNHQPDELDVWHAVEAPANRSIGDVLSDTSGQRTYV